MNRKIRVIKHTDQRPSEQEVDRFELPGSQLGHRRFDAVDPMIAVPVSLIGTFAIFPYLGFSINTLSLFGCLCLP